MATIKVMDYSLKKTEVEVQTGDRVKDILERAAKLGAQVRGNSSIVVTHGGRRDRNFNSDTPWDSSWELIEVTRQL